MPPLVIDVRMHGRPKLTAAYLMRDGDSAALVDTGPASSWPATAAALDAAQVVRLDWIVLTHVHLDHAGAAGQLAARYPEARIAVHPRGARHIADPARLWQGVSSVYGARTEALWGRPEPVAADRISAVEDGDAITFRGRRLTALETPGHARHHHAWLDAETGDAFTGDAVGMQVGDYELWRPTTPPADFDPQAARRSVQRLRDAAPGRLFLGHFGAATADGDERMVDAVLDAGERVLDAWVTAVSAAWRANGEAELVATLRRWIDGMEAAWPDAARAAMDATSDLAVDVAGVVGWLERHREAAAVGGGS